jgi:thiamine-monophosphate kinase
VDSLYRGISDALSEFGGELLGGDTVRSDRITVSVAAVGTLAGARPLLRSGARRGDLVCVTGSLGRPELGLLLLKKYVGRKGGSRSSAMLAWAGRRVGDFREQIPARIRRDGYACILKHLMPAPRMPDARLLARRGNGAPSSMIDVSDGLSSDLNQLSVAGGVDILVREDRIPVHPSVVRTARHLGVSASRAAMSSGEEYELLLTVPPRHLGGLVRAMKRSGTAPLTVIGEVTGTAGVSRCPGVWVVGPGAARRRLVHKGFKHF